MKDKSIIVGAIAGFLLIVLLLFFTSGTSTKTIDVGDYTLKLGKYKAVNAKDDDSLLILKEDSFAYEDSEDDKYEITIGENELLFLGSPFFIVTGNDEFELEGDRTVKYVYVGETIKNNKKASSVAKDSIANTENIDSQKQEAKADTKKDKNVKIKEVNNLKLVDYKTTEFTMKIPEGWKVSKGGYGVYFGLRVYDPNDDRNQIFYILKEQPFYKYEEAISLYNLSRGYCPGIAMGGAPSTEQVFKVFNTFANKAVELQNSMSALEYKGLDFPYISNFTVVESKEGNSILHNQAVDDKILRATFNNGSSTTDGEAEGLFSACVVDFGTLGYGNDKFSYYMAYNVSGITTAKDELINYEEVLLTSLNSLQFTAEYSKMTTDQINMQTNNALNLSSQLRQAYQSYNDAWSNRQKTYDIMSQKQSDATLGYERVYDTETGEIYKAYNGFTSDYKGNRYKAIDDSQYSEKITGYIEK